MTATSDEEFLAAFERLEIRKEDFHHRDHLRLAWSCLRHAAPQGALDRVRTAICRFAEKYHVPHLYHQTITRFWVEHLAETMRAFPDVLDFATLADRRPEMLDKDLIRRRYRPDTLAGERAKAEWVEPDA